VSITAIVISPQTADAPDLGARMYSPIRAGRPRVSEQENTKLCARAQALGFIASIDETKS
jgi:hypothetical protein